MPQKSVLIVEDDIEFAEFLNVAARSAGYRAQVARDGDEAVDLFTILEPDLVLLDLLLPKKDGFAVAAEIRAHATRGRTPVVMITGVYRKREYLEQAQRTLGVDEFLTKPVRIVDLWRVFDRYLGGEGSMETEASGDEPARVGVSENDFHGDPLSEKPFSPDNFYSDCGKSLQSSSIFLL